MRAARAQEINYDKYLIDWPMEYYRFMDAMERKKLLQLSIERGLDPEGDALRMEIWNRRYPNADVLAERGDTIIDAFLAVWVHLDYVNERIGSWFMSKKLVKDTKKHLEKMGIARYEASDNNAKEAIRNELYHLACYYIKFCREDSKFNSLVMGVGKLNEEAFANKIAETFYHVCYRAPKGIGLENEFKSFQEAAHDAYEDIFPQFVQFLDDRIIEGK